MAKQSISVAIEAELLAEAQANRVDLSQALEDRLRELLTRERAWRLAHRGAIDSYNEYIARNGIFGEEFRRF